MDYRVRFTSQSWRGPVDRVRKYMCYTSVKAVIRAIKSEYDYPENDHDFRVVEIDLFEDTPESRLVATKESGRVNFSWRKPYIPKEKLSC